MATARVPGLRGRLDVLLRGGPRQAGASQRRWARVHDVRFLATTQASRSVLEKYREKLDRKAREEGYRDVDALRAAYGERIREVRRRDGVAGVPGLDAVLGDAPTPTDARGAPPIASYGATRNPPGGGARPLAEILDLGKARALPERELAAVWRLRHAGSARALCAAIPAATFAAVEATARRHPAFVLPVPRAGAGAELHYLQWIFEGGGAAAAGGAETRTATVLFTRLAEFQARGEWALPHTSATHYFDGGEGGLSTRGDAAGGAVVLMAGAVVEGRGASVGDARWLVSLLPRFYGAEGRGATPADAGKRRLLEEFSRGDAAFTVERLLEETEKLV
ncbi:ATP11-domain-containing protein [Durotheca rogersii]|uniref:ATP11-domain-containing protein n=1 Tax=Durotheca rogersii TaxID=419775 RepID=UPI00221F61C3|nr:ATP11-domain-containing protein [Durotheca rogersii]KAI5866611.1 ATP11-domain-containing protein [Durotheca rogersii]